MNIKFKVCGMRNKANIADIGFTEPDYMGFIYYSKSPRFVGDHFVIPSGLPANIKRVGVFVDASTEYIMNQVNLSRLDYVQLHGSEGVAQCEELKNKGVGVIKAFAVDEAFDFGLTSPYKKGVNYFLFDTKGPHHGGNSRAFNWELLNRYDQEVPFFLSGGISAENIKNIIQHPTWNVHAIDVNSKVELSPGLKSTRLVVQLKSVLGNLSK
jgi:phosphoribosylanthranilate isomerase